RPSPVSFEVRGKTAPLGKVAILPAIVVACPRRQSAMIRYAIDVAATHRHTFAVELRVDDPAAGQRFSLPVWIPGSYLVREFARHLSALVAEQDGAPVTLQ